MDGGSRRCTSFAMRSDYGMSLVYIFAASRMEAEPIRKMVGSPDLSSPASCGTNNLVCIVSGMGPRNARNKAEVALGIRTEPSVSPKANAVLVIGLCGGLTESLPEGRVVAYTACKSTETTKPILNCSRTISDALVTLLASAGIPCDRAVGITAPRIATNRKERLALAEFGAATVRRWKERACRQVGLHMVHRRCRRLPRC
jgi:hypothetical protein